MRAPNTSCQLKVRPRAKRTRLTLFRDLDLTSAELGLLDVLHAEVAAALGIDLSPVAWRGLVVRAVRVGRS